MRWAERTNFEVEQELASPGSSDRAGKPFLDLTVSNPTRCGFTYDAATILPLAEPANLTYSAEPFGPLRARRAVAEEYYARKGLQTDAERIMLTSSTSEAYSFLFRLLCNPGDQVLVPSPSYPLFDLLARLHDVELLHYPMHRHDAWSLDAHACERLITSRTRAVIVVNPNNPTGHFTTVADRRVLYKLACKHGLALIADEVFADYAFSATATSFLQSDAAALTFVLSGLSKVLALPQMKLAWTVVCGPETVCQEALRRLEFIADTFLPVSAPVANALPQWLNATAQIQKQVRDRVQANLKVLDEQIQEGSLLGRLPVEGGWSVILRVPAILPDIENARQLLDHEAVAVHPGSFYGLPASGYLIASLLVPTPDFREAVTRIASSVDK